MDSVITLSAGFIADGKRIFTRAEKIFELSNHLGNVLVTLSDRRVQHSTGGTTVDYYRADIASANDYYPFSMMMPARKYSSSASYRYGFNGKEMDNGVYGQGNVYDYGFRIYNPRIGKFLSVDPLVDKYPELTPYQFASNSPVANIDLDGQEAYWYQFTTDTKTGNTEVKLTAVKTSWLDWFTISHLVVKINDHDWFYDADYVKSNGELDAQVAKIKADPEAYYQSMQERHGKKGSRAC